MIMFIDCDTTRQSHDVMLTGGNWCSLEGGHVSMQLVCICAARLLYKRHCGAMLRSCMPAPVHLCDMLQILSQLLLVGLDWWLPVQMRHGSP